LVQEDKEVFRMVKEKVSAEMAGGCGSDAYLVLTSVAAPCRYYYYYYTTVLLLLLLHTNTTTNNIIMTTTFKMVVIASLSPVDPSIIDDLT